MMYCNIDQILDLFDWHQSEENQNRGLALARNVKSVHVFLQPGDERHNKNVWENCAKVIVERSDRDLRPYLYDLLEWILDLTWPGSLLIYDRLKKYRDEESFKIAFSCALHHARALEEEIWESNLRMLQEERDHMRRDK